MTIPAAASRRRQGGSIWSIGRTRRRPDVQQFLPAPRRDSDDYYALLLADAVWGGGGFGTRLNLNLREDKGYSYGVFSTLQLLQEAGSWYAAGGVQTDKTKESVVEFDKELKALGGAQADHGRRVHDRQAGEDARLRAAVRGVHARRPARSPTSGRRACR